MRPPNVTADVLSDIHAERRRQDAIWARRPGKWDQPLGLKLAVLMEEVGEIASELQNNEINTVALRNELIQTAAVCVAWAETLPDD